MRVTDRVDAKDDGEIEREETPEKVKDEDDNLEEEPLDPRVQV